MPTYLIGLPQIALMESAAPPLVSPSSFVSDNARYVYLFIEGVGNIYAVLPQHGVHDKQDFFRLLPYPLLREAPP